MQPRSLDFFFRPGDALVPRSRSGHALGAVLICMCSSHPRCRAPAVFRAARRPPISRLSPACGSLYRSRRVPAITIRRANECPGPHTRRIDFCPRCHAEAPICLFDRAGAQCGLSDSEPTRRVTFAAPYIAARSPSLGSASRTAAPNENSKLSAHATVTP